MEIKRFFGALAFSSTLMASSSFAASPAAITAAVRAATTIINVQSVNVLVDYHCADCALIEVNGLNMAAQPAYAKVKTSRLNHDPQSTQVVATVIEESN